MCGEVYPKITKRLAQAINGRKEGIHIYGSDWQQLARQVSLSPARTLKRVEELCELVTANVDAAKDAIASSPAGPHQILDRIAFEVKKRVKRIRSQLSKLDQSPSDAYEEAAAVNN